MSLIQFGLLFIALTASALAQRAIEPPDCTQDALIVNVLDLHDKPIDNLHKNNFRVKLNRTEIDVEAATYQVKPGRIVVALDLSGSMAGGPGHDKLQVARTAAEAMTSVPAPQVPIALLAFSAKVEKTFGFGQSRSAIVDWLSTIGATPSAAPHGTTALFDAIAAADKMLEPYQEGDAIYAITDGQDDHSVITAKKLEHELQRDRVRLYLFLLSDRIPFEELQAEVRDVAALAANTGGFVFGRSSNNLLSWAGDTHYEFNDRIKQNIEVQTGLLIVQIGGFYRIDIANTGRRGTESRLSLHVVDEKGKQRKDVAVTFPRKILLCGEPQISQ